MLEIGTFVRYVGEPVHAMSFPQCLEVIGRHPHRPALVDVRDMNGTEFYVHNCFLHESTIQRPHTKGK